MGTILVIIAIAVALFLVIMVVKTGPSQVDESRLAGATVLRRVEAGDGSWDELGSRTEAEGLGLRFDHDDDPEAEAWLLARRPPEGKRSQANVRTVTLQSAFSTHHVHARGSVFRIRLRGTGTVVGKEVEIKVWNTARGVPYAGAIGLDDDDDVAMGDWIEVDWAEILTLRPR